MRFVQPPQRFSSPGIVSAKGVYTNRHGRRTHHPRRRETLIPFVGVDGEGITINGEHRYVLFGVGDDQISDPDGLHWSRIFDFLYDHYKPNTAYVGFYLGYDFAQMLKTLPENRAFMLLTEEGKKLRRHNVEHKAPHPVECEDWQFDILGNKRLRIRPKTCQCDVATCPCKPKKPWMYICDAGPFFQTSFLNVINPKEWPDGECPVTQEEYDVIERGKSQRASAVLDDEMRAYNRLENDVLARVMHTLNVGFHAMGIHLPPSKWFGPGQAAQQWMKNEQVPERQLIETTVPPWFLEAARMAYFGGWFEIFAHGIIPGESHEYDLNSAYPWAIANLPCLLHGTYDHGIGIPPSDSSGRDLILVHARVWSPGMPTRNTPVGAMLHRDSHGRILRPSATEGWFWWDELKAAERTGCVKRLDNRGKQHVYEWVRYRPCDCPPPMRRVEELYQFRLSVGKKTPQGKAAKLTYNSKYGKAAQSIGEPIFGNPIYASRITSQCRTRILDAIGSHPDGMQSVLMVATDGVYFLNPHPGLVTSDRLGEWDHATRENLTLFKPGVYWDDSARRALADGQHPKFKARGIAVADFASQITAIDECFAAWNTTDGPPAFPRVVFRSQFALTSPLQALRRGKWETAGAVASGVELVQDSDPSDKRTAIYLDTSQPERPVWRSRPYDGMALDPSGGLEWIRSEPYAKRFGMEDPWSDEYREQFGITEDGTVMDMLAELLRN